MNDHGYRDNISYLAELQRQQFHRDGFLVVRNMASRGVCDALLDTICKALDPPLAPLEYEADVRYPGAPYDLGAPGGRTPRRLLHAYARDKVFRDWACDRRVIGIVCQLLGCAEVQLTQNHHNCIMTKFPGYSSKTHWHQDIRYWSFDRPELLNVWLALGEESTARGGMQLIPGSHTIQLDRGRFDAALFLRTDLPENRELLKMATSADLHVGDALFFHCRTYHAAGVNTTKSPKFSLVFSYHAGDNTPIPETRSSRYAEVSLAQH